jgi:hypothetical protein
MLKWQLSNQGITATDCELHVKYWNMNLPSCRIGKENYNCYLVFGTFLAELGPESRSYGSGSNNGAERTQNQPRGQIPRPSRDHVLVRSHITKIKNVSLSEKQKDYRTRDKEYSNLVAARMLP